MNRNAIYFIVGALVIAVIVLGVVLYNEKQSDAGLSVEIGDGGISVETE